MADTATLVYDIDSKAARTAASDLAKLNDASARAAGGANSLNKTLRDSQGRFRSSYDVAKQYGDEIRGLAAKYNPALNAVYQYQNAQLELNRAVALGVLSQQQADAALERTAAQIRATASASLQMAAAQKANGAQTANVFSQLNDIGVMLAAGQNPFQLALQQGTQLNQVWASMGKEGRTLGGVFGMLKGAVASMLSPMSLLTIGTIAGAAALTQWASSLLSSEEDVKSVDDAMSQATSSLNAYTSSLEASKAPIDELIKKYGALSLVAQEALRNMANADRVQAARDIAAALSSSIEAVTSYSLFGVNQGLDASIAKVGVLSEEWARMAPAIERVRVAQTDLERIAASRALSSEMIAAYGSLEKMPDEMVALYNNLQKSITNISAADGATNSWAGAMSGVLSYVNAIGRSLSSIGGGAIQLAAIRTETELLKQGKSLRDASFEASKKTAELEGKQRTAQLEAQYGIIGKGLAALENNQKMSIINAQQELSIQQEIAREREREANKKASGGGGGGGAAELARAEKQFQSLRELLEQDSLFQVAEYEKRQEQLQAALDKRLITEQQYNEMRTQLQIFYFGTEYERNALQYQLDLEQLNLHYQNRLILEEQYQAQRAALQWQYTNQSLDLDSTALGAHLNGLSQYFGNANSLAGGGYEKLIKLQKTFAAASAFVSAYQGASMALTDPTMTTWQRIAAAGKVLATGIGFVNAIKGGGSGGGSGRSSAASAAAATKQEPTRYIEISVQGDSWAVGLVENVMDQIYEQTKNGRVIIGGAQ